MGWFDSLTSKQPDDFGSFNYQTEQEQLKRRRALAQQLMQDGTSPLKTQTVPGGPNGFVVPNGKGEVFAQIAKSLLGAYLSNKTDDAQKSLDQKSLDALAYNIDNKPWEKRATDESAAKAAAALLADKPQEQGGWAQPSNPDVQSYPVRDASIETRQLPPASVPAGSTNPIAGVVAGTPTTAGPSTYAGNGGFKPLIDPRFSAGQVADAAGKANAKLSADDIALASRFLGGAQAQPSAAPAPVAAQSVPAAVPVTPSVPQRNLLPDAAASSAPVPAAPQLQAAPVPAQLGPTMAEQMAYLQRIANSGPAGQQTAQAMMTQLMAKPQLQHVTVKNEDGSESVVAFDPSGRMKPQVVFAGSQGSGPSPNQLKRDEFAGKAFENYTKAQEELNTAQQQYGKVQNARELLSRYAPTGGVFSSIYSGIARALGNDQANALDMALKDLAFSDLRSTFGGNPTEGERKAQMDVKASVERGLAPSLASLDTLAAGVERRMRLGAQQADYWRSNVEQYRTQQPRQAANPLLDSLFPPKR